MPVPIAVEWAVVKKPGTYRPFIRSRGRVFTGTPTIMNQDQPLQLKADIVVSTDEQVYAMNVSEMLNREIGHDGYWMVAWAEPAPIIKTPTEMVCRWLDVDKDVQFRVWIEGPFAVIVGMPLQDIVGSCERAWQEWNEVTTKWLAVHPGQKVKAQLGERVEMPNFGPAVFGG